MPCRCLNCRLRCHNSQLSTLVETIIWPPPSANRNRPLFTYVKNSRMSWTASPAQQNNQVQRPSLPIPIPVRANTRASGIRAAMIFVPSVLLALFSATFFGMWMSDRKRPHLLWFAGAFLMYATGILAQLLIPLGNGLNTMLSAALYTGGAVIFGQGVMRRSGKQLNLSFQIITFVTLITVIGYFLFIVPNLTMRAYMLNFGLAAIFLLIALQARFLVKGTPVDRLLFVTVLCVGLHFVPRTILTISSILDDTGVLRSDSSFWAWIPISLTVLGATAGICLLLVASADVIYGLRLQRNTDALTGLLNRYGLETWADARAQTRRNTDQASVVLCDVDHFKRINDKYGHATGDRVLIEVAERIRQAARDADLVGRIGGEEFVVILRNGSRGEAYILAERMRQAIEAMRLSELGPDGIITGSFGIAEFYGNENLWSVIDRADKNLYAAKRAGRNRIAGGDQTGDPVYGYESSPAAKPADIV